MVETWKPIVGYEGLYEVSDAGRIRSMARAVLQPYRESTRVHHRIGRLRKSHDANKYGHQKVWLRKQGRDRSASVHRLVLEAFVGPAPAGMEGCHNNGNPRDNALTNLRWDTHESNSADTVKHGRHHFADRDRCPRGHLLISPNLVTKPSAKGRECLSCNRATTTVSNRRRRNQPIPELQALADAKYLALGFSQAGAA